MKSCQVYCGQVCPWNTLYGCKKPDSEPCILSNMRCARFEKKPMTNADHIRSMTDEELAEFLLNGNVAEVCPNGCDNCDGDCDQHMLDWLKQPYKEEV